MNENCLVVLSGGLDSTVCLFDSKLKYKNVYTVTFHYGQKHSIEIEAAKKISEIANVVSHTIIDVSSCLESVFDGGTNFTPMRNTLFITIAANKAVKIGNCDIVLGVCQTDDTNYPDCRYGFIKSMEKSVNLSLGNNGKNFINIQTPLINMQKFEIIKHAEQLGCLNYLEHTHTSYDGEYPPISVNDANVIRAKGFLDAGIPDPLVVKAWKEGLISLPNTINYDSLKGGDLV